METSRDRNGVADEYDFNSPYFDVPCMCVEHQAVLPTTNPPYYNGDDVMQVIERYNLGFCLGNSVKYILRAGKKVDSDKLNRVSTQKEHADLVKQFTLDDLKKALAEGDSKGGVVEMNSQVSVVDTSNDSDFVKRTFAKYQQLSPEHKREFERFVDQALGIVSSDAATSGLITLLPQTATSGGEMY